MKRREQVQVELSWENVKSWINKNPGNALRAWRNFWVGYRNGRSEDELLAELHKAVVIKNQDSDTTAYLDWVETNYPNSKELWKGELQAFLSGNINLSDCEPYKRQVTLD